MEGGVTLEIPAFPLEGVEEVEEEQKEEDWENISFSFICMDGMEDPFKDKWKQVEARYQQRSAYSDFKSFRLRPFIIKANDDLRQEVLAM